MRETRGALGARHPTLAPGSVVVQQNLPHGLEYALGGDRALQVWYRDRSLGWTRFEDFRREPGRPVAAIVQFQPRHPTPVAIVEPDASRAQLEAEAHLHAGRYPEVLSALDRADAAQRDTAAIVFRVLGATWRGYALTQLGRPAEGERSARAAVGLDRADVNARFALAAALAALERPGEALAQLDTLLALAPGDRDARALRERLLAGPVTSLSPATSPAPARAAPGAAP
jgi:tetratricopeptide (TPR) repeat protein